VLHATYLRGNAARCVNL
jgi:hypothetical protein